MIILSNLLIKYPIVEDMIHLHWLSPTCLIFKFTHYYTLINWIKFFLYSVIKEIGAVFYEASALSGENVQEAHKKIAKLLFKRELKRITKVMEELESSSFNVFDVREEMPTTQSVKTGCNC